MKIAPEIDGISIIVVGPMNPPIFQPSWLERVQLVQRADVEDCKIEVIHNDISILKFPNFSIQVQSERNPSQSFPRTDKEQVRAP